MGDGVARRSIAEVVAEVRELVGQMREEFPGLEADAAAWESTVDGQSDALDRAERLMVAALQIEADAEALDAQIRQMTARRARFVAGARRIRGLVELLMRAAEVKRLHRPRFTISLREGSPMPVAVDPSETPSQLWKPPPPPEPDRAAILRLLRAGETVPGWSLGSGAPFLIVNRG